MIGTMNDQSEPVWSEQLSRQFLDYGRYFVPDRERQIAIVVGLMPARDAPLPVLELCCGEGLLAEALLERYPACQVTGLDGSAEMLRRARKRLARFGPRFQAGEFDLAATSWRKPGCPIHAVVSSLAIHHLDGPQKQELFADVYALLQPGGTFVVADMIEPAHDRGREVAADEWDDVVRERSVSVDGDTAGFEFFAREGWNTYRYPDPDDIDKPSGLLDQLKWLEQAGFTGIDVHYMRAGHAIFSSWKPEASPRT